FEVDLDGFVLLVALDGDVDGRGDVGEASADGSGGGIAIRHAVCRAIRGGHHDGLGEATLFRVAKADERWPMGRRVWGQTIDASQSMLARRASVSSAARVHSRPTMAERE